MYNRNIVYMKTEQKKHDASVTGKRGYSKEQAYKDDLP